MNNVIEQAVDKVKTGLGRLVHRQIRPVEMMEPRRPKATPASEEAPPVDVFESAKEFVIVADVPAADASSTSAYWDGNSLSIDTSRRERASRTRDFGTRRPRTNRRDR